VDLLGGVRKPKAVLGAADRLLVDILQRDRARLLDHKDGFHSGRDTSAKLANLESAPMTASRNGFGCTKGDLPHRTKTI
jgi:hypothetical protein